MARLFRRMGVQIAHEQVLAGQIERHRGAGV
jgi:hypothetical protein